MSKDIEDTIKIEGLVLPTYSEILIIGYTLNRSN